MNGDETRDMLFGRLFGLMSIVASGMIARDSTTTEDIIRIVESLHEMALAKSYLAEVCHHVVINLLPYVSILCRFFIYISSLAKTHTHKSVVEGN